MAVFLPLDAGLGWAMYSHIFPVVFGRLDWSTAAVRFDMTTDLDIRTF
jgi:hypothetical protein